MPEPEAPDLARTGEHPLPWSRPGVLVGLDGSAASLAALRMAVDLGP